MGKMLFSLILTTVWCVGVSAMKSVTYKHVGYFSNAPPFDNTNALPQSPIELRINHSLYTPTNTIHAYALDYTNSKAFETSPFNKNLPIKILIHGFLSNAKNSWVSKTKDAILKKGGANVINVDWSRGANNIYYSQSVANTRVVAAEISIVLNQMKSLAGVSMENVHIIGHSLGAHIAGFVGQLQNSTIGRITALDAAEPNFIGRPLDARVDASDAKFVDAVHTNGGGIGFNPSFGHVDFYVNGGNYQPGCSSASFILSSAITLLIGKRSLTTEYFACDHVRAHELFTESIQSICKFKSFPCDNHKNFKKGDCVSCGADGTSCNEFGYYASNFKGRGNQYVETLDNAPFCGNQYVLKVTFKESIPEGQLKIILFGKRMVQSATVLIEPSKIIIDSRTVQTLVVADKKISCLADVSVIRISNSYNLYHQYETYTIERIEITDMDDGQRYVSSFVKKPTVRVNNAILINVIKV